MTLSAVKRIILVADAGGTSINWQMHIALHDQDNNSHSDFSVATSGVNAANASPLRLEESFNEAFQLLSLSVERFYHTNIDLKAVLTSNNAEIYYYGAGCKGDECIERITAALHKCFGRVRIQVNSDLLGAARATLGNKPGIVAIMGTGSNSGFYNGTKLIANTPPMGYILGDEGSGTAIGKRFLSDIFKGLAPESLSDYVIDHLKVTQESVIKSVYRSENPASYLASQTKVIGKILDLASKHPSEYSGVATYLNDIITDSFITFFKRNFEQYKLISEPKEVCFVGSVAYFFRPCLEKAAKECGYQIGVILNSPIRNIVNFHINNNNDE